VQKQQIAQEKEETQAAQEALWERLAQLQDIVRQSLDEHMQAWQFLRDAPEKVAQGLDISKGQLMREVKSN
jgi:hypothetical protein